jgi:hypothetical protein
MNSDGSAQTPLVSTSEAYANNENYGSPVWSPDGTKIAVEKQVGSAHYIAVISADGLSNTNILGSAARVSKPAWSPTKTLGSYQIAYESASGTGGFGYAQIYIAREDGTNQLQLTGADTGGNDGAPVWSPDGTRIYFFGYRAPNSSVYYYTTTDNWTTASNVTTQLLGGEAALSGVQKLKISGDGSTLAYNYNVPSEIRLLSTSTGVASYLTTSPGVNIQNYNPTFVWASWPPVPPADNTVAFSSPSSSDGYGIRQITDNLPATGNQRFELGWSSSPQAAPNPSDLQTITNMKTKKGPISFLGKYTSTGYVGGTQPNEDWYLWVRSVKTSGSADAWATPLKVHTPKAGVFVAVGDSFISGHHQDADERYCPNADDLLLYPGNTPCAIAGAPYVVPNDYAFSWLVKATANLNNKLHVPDGWQITSKNAAISGMSTAAFGNRSAAVGTIGPGRWAEEGTQAGNMYIELNQRYNSWNYLALGGGADDTNWTSAMTDWYRDHFAAQYGPWDVPKQSECLNTQSVYAYLMSGTPTTSSRITTNLQGVVSVATAASPSVRVVNVDYPYVVDSKNPCYKNSGPWHGVKAVIDVLHNAHAAVTGSNVKMLDLRDLFGAKPVTSGYFQLTRLYGYPHASGAATSSNPGQTRIADAAATLAGSTTAW